jgi:type VI secretion system protein ImpC
VLLSRLCADRELARAVADALEKSESGGSEDGDVDDDSADPAKSDKNEEAANFIAELRQASSKHLGAFEEPSIAPLASMVANGAFEYSPRSLAEALRTQLAVIDKTVGRQLDALLHHPDFQSLEARWRALARLVNAIPADANIEIRILDYAQTDLLESIDRAPCLEDTVLWREVVDGAIETFGASPFGLLIADYEFDHRPADVKLMYDLARLGEAAQAPVVAGARPTLFGIGSIAELKAIRNPGLLLEDPAHTKWRSLRDLRESRFMALTLSRALCRVPYGKSGEACTEFAYEEHCDDASSYCWSNPTFLFAENALRAFHRYGWCARIGGPTRGGLIEQLPRVPGDRAAGTRDVGPAEVTLSSRSAKELCELGLMPLVPHANAARAVFPRAVSVRRPSHQGDVDLADQTPQLDRLLAVCRFALYLRCMARDGVGGAASVPELEFQLRNWLKPYVDPEAASNENARHPLVDFDFKIEPVKDGSGRYRGVLEIEPGYQLLEAETVRVVFDLPGAIVE